MAMRAVEVDAELARRFDELAEQWRRETQGLSNSEAILEHPAYLEILEMGPPALPLILRDFEQRGWHWHAALHQLTATKPYPRGTRGRERMRQAWLAWGREAGVGRCADQQAV